MATPWKDPRSGVYYLYRKVPEPLRAEMKGGKAFVRRSLGTKDPREAARLFVARNAEFEEELDQARLAVAARAARDEISAERARVIVAAFLEADASGKWSRWPSLARLFLVEDMACRHYGTAPPGLAPLISQVGSIDFEQLHGERLVGDSWLEAIRSLPRVKWLTCCRLILDPLFEGSASAIPRTPGNEAALMDAVNEAVARDNARLHQDVESPRRRPTVSRLRPDLRFGELLTLWETKKKPSGQTAHETRQSVNDLIEYFGDMAVERFTRDMLMDYRDAAATLPSTMPRADRTLPFTARLEKHGDTPGERIKPQTLKKRLGGVQALIGLAHGEGWISQNVGLRIPIANYSRTAKPRRSFRDGELATLFKASLFLNPAGWRLAGRAVSDATLYWLFLLGTTSGARIEEIGQVHLLDVKLDNGVPIIDIDDYILGDDAMDDESPAAEKAGKSLKNDESRRVIPIHGRLLALGFMAYVEELRTAGQTMLFPDLGAGAFGKHTKEASRLVNRLIDRIVSKDSRLVFHSLRHKFKDEGRNARLPDSIIDQLTGHSPPTVGGRYGEGAAVRELAIQLERIRFDMVDWGALGAVAATIDWPVVVRSLSRSQKIAKEP